MHFSEFSAVAIALIETGLADSRPHEAQSWLDIWARAMPGNPTVEVFRREIQRRSRPRP